MPQDLDCKLWSIIPMLRYEEGHPYGYNLAVGRAAMQNGWQHGALIPTSCLIHPLPNTWHKCLAEDYFTKEGSILIWHSSWKKFTTLLKSILPLMKALKMACKCEKPILLLEQFFLGQMLAFGIAAMLSRPKAQIWILHRYSSRQMGKKALVYRWIQKRLPQVKLLADSDLLSQDLELFFKQKVHVMPIPHTDDIVPSQRKPSEVIHAWWPGGFTTPAKGLPIIQKIAQREERNFVLYLADNAKEHLTNTKMSLVFLPSHMPRKTYVQQMMESDVVLLPYSPKIYHFATSGIFVEAIVAGAVPFVTDGTWMAHEARRFGISKLIVTWDDPNLFTHIRLALQDDTTRSKLAHLQKEYASTHSVSGYAKAMKSVFHM